MVQAQDCGCRSCSQPRQSVSNSRWDNAENRPQTLCAGAPPWANLWPLIPSVPKPFLPCVMVVQGKGHRAKGTNAEAHQCTHTQVCRHTQDSAGTHTYEQTHMCSCASKGTWTQ